MEPPGERLKTALSVALVLASAIAIMWLAIGAGDLRGIVVVLLVFGVPAAVAAGVIAVAARRSV